MSPTVQDRPTTGEELKMRHWRLVHGLCVLLVILAAAVVGAAEWGTLKGQFIYDGKAPPRNKLNVTTDVDIGTKDPPLDESLMVAEDGGLANVVVYIRARQGQKLAIHPDGKATANQPVVLDNQNGRFDPHIVLVQTGQKLLIKNSDSVQHITKADLIRNRSFNVLIPSAGQQVITLPEGEPLPVRVVCNRYPWMTGFLVVREEPHMAISANDGSFEIKNIPVGTHEFQFWQELPGRLKGIKFDGGETDERGRGKIKISSGVTDLGVITVSPALLAGK